MYFNAYANEMEDSYLAIKIKDEKESDNASVSLIIPSKKIIVEGGKMTDNIQYAFEEKSGKIKLPIGEKAYIMATKEMGGEIYFDLKEFKISNSQTIEMYLKKSSKRKILNSIDELKLDDVRINIKVNPNKKELLKIDKKLKEVESLKPHNCSCDETKVEEVWK
jgi:hypothetical protein